MGQGASTEKYRLLLVGVTGSGKSSLGNAILGRQAFVSASGFGGITQGCSLQKATINKIDLEVVDTPGFCDPGRSDESIHTTIAQYLSALSPGPHAVLIVMKASQRYSGDLDKAYAEAKKLLDDHELASRIILVFTGADQLRTDKVDFDAQLQQQSENFKEMMQDARHRYVLFNNRASGAESKKQLEDLLTKVRMACMQVQGAEASEPDFTFLSSDLQKEIEAIISNESKEIAKSKNIPIEEARLQVRQAMAQANETDEALKQAMARVRDAIKTHKVEVNVNCTLL